jgi:hypothetical protein
LRCSDNTIVSLISFRELNSLHPGYRAAVAGQRCLYSLYCREGVFPET